MALPKFPNIQSNPAGAIPIWDVVSLGFVAPGMEYFYYEQITDLAAATSLSPPDEAALVRIQVNDGKVRYRNDGTPPTGDVGMLLEATTTFPAPFNLLQFIQDTGSTSSINVEWYGPSS